MAPAGISEAHGLFSPPSMLTPESELEAFPEFVDTTKYEDLADSVRAHSSESRTSKDIRNNCDLPKETTCQVLPARDTTDATVDEDCYIVYELRSKVTGKKESTRSYPVSCHDKRLQEASPPVVSQGRSKAHHEDWNGIFEDQQSQKSTLKRVATYCARCDGQLLPAPSAYVRAVCGHVFCDSCVKLKNGPSIGQSTAADLSMKCRWTGCESNNKFRVVRVNMSTWSQCCPQSPSRLAFFCVKCMYNLGCSGCCEIDNDRMLRGSCTGCKKLYPHTIVAALDPHTFYNGITFIVRDVIDRKVGAAGWPCREYLLRYYGRSRACSRWASPNDDVFASDSAALSACKRYDEKYPYIFADLDSI